jgi:hypothetical protein
MQKLDYERKRPGNARGFARSSDTKWPFILLGSGAGILLCAAVVDAGIGVKALELFTVLLGLTGVKAVGDIFAGFLAAMVLRTELGTFGIAALKLAAISVLCTALAAPFQFSGLSIFVTAPVRWGLLMVFFDIEMFSAVIFTIASGIVLVVVNWFLMAGAGH